LRSVRFAERLALAALPGRSWEYEKARNGVFHGKFRRTSGAFYPAHLHMNIDGQFRRMGIGKRLIESYFADLRRHGSSGIHLFCGGDPLQFYLHAAFKYWLGVGYLAGVYSERSQRAGMTTKC